ncbi:hypothetical protein FNV43_RR09492 [Rhamnella rubrinervis]|uniref:Protein LNK2 n=1 Tax=Rhamnella rubrinervis TaxID=2594499 RepID=A0A8K0HAT1_9ROSA|nr:hypothetical protein FNV43_RR09492 [Rhamnella rubrinervis]
MFDWDDEELANIIWGEGAESDDHIVPYPEASENCCNKKELNHEASTIKHTEQKTPGAKIDLHRKLNSGSNLGKDGVSAKGFGMESWPDLSISNIAKSEQDSLCTEVSNSLSEITKYDTPRGTNQLDEEAELYQNTREGKEQNDFVDYGWSSIGSFDDLDRIFSNDDTIFGNVSLGNSDGLWASAKDAARSPVEPTHTTLESPSLGLGTLRATSQHLDIKTECEEQDDQSGTLRYGKIDNSSLHAILDHAEDVGGRNKPIGKDQTDLDKVGKTTLTSTHSAAENVATRKLNEISDKAIGPKKQLKCRRKLREKSEGKALQDLYGSWSSSRNPSRQFENQLAQAMVQSSPSSVEQRQLQGPESFQFQNISNQFAAPSVYGNMMNSCPAVPVLSHVRPEEFKHQSLLSSYEVSPSNVLDANKSAEAPGIPLTMTPQEKIEKLRRRQQLQAMLAIQKQQQQFGRQISYSNHSTTQNCPQENQIQQFEDADLEVEDLVTLPSIEPNSPIEQDDSNTISAAVEDNSMEETILFRLQDIISKLDIKVRLCIRDSLFRLAQSTMQRHYASDTSSTNKSSKDRHEGVAKDEINSGKRYFRMPDAETETNPIDRTVAHLLFHRPLEISGKHLKTPESPICSKFPFERRSTAIVNMPLGCLPETSKNKHSFPHQQSKDCSVLLEPQPMDQYKNSPCIETSENASNNGLEDDGTMLIVSSQ